MRKKCYFTANRVISRERGHVSGRITLYIFCLHCAETEANLHSVDVFKLHQFSHKLRKKRSESVGSHRSQRKIYEKKLMKQTIIMCAKTKLAVNCQANKQFRSRVECLGAICDLNCKIYSFSLVNDSLIFMLIPDSINASLCNIGPRSECKST